MENHDNLVKKLLEKDELFRNAYKTHKDYENKLEKLEKKPRLSSTETAEKNRMKKLKLALKDEMEKKLYEFRQHEKGA
ncbi:MAG: DUF465 domain-containing protein [Deltaproteobacteria bacterium]|nr:DUF465 domain-containing protein [Deltaproteobacteria bacterium]